MQTGTAGGALREAAVGCRPAGVQEMFESQAGRTPARPALLYEGKEMAYEELNRRANQLAHYLRTRGAGPEVLVALYMKRSLEMVVGVLGILKSGSAYVPLDLGWPEERLSFIIEDTRASLVLTEDSLAGRLPDPSMTLCLERNWREITLAPAANPAGPDSPSSLACVLYTSGSTGRPKGVMITHGSLAHYTSVARREFGLHAGDRVLQFASIAFDSSLEEIFPTLTAGATLVLRNEQMVESFGTFLQEAGKLQLTVLDLPTGYFHELTSRLDENGGAKVPQTLRLVILGGEKAHAERIRTWRRHAEARVRLVNTYGPTETTVVATMCDLAATVEQPGSEVPIGDAVADVQVHLLDGRMRPVPAGGTGELYIGGAGVARGYLNRPELTAANFIPDPFSPVPGARLYRTGDLVRRQSDGSLVFLGRLDYQVKIRGFRVELEGIESLLAAHPSVQRAAVKVHEERPGDKRLVAYLVPRTGTVPRAGELRRYLQARAPEYMIPGTFVWVQRLPLTAGGKVDRGALPPPPRSRPDLDRPLVAPRNRLEAELKHIWEELLNLQPVSVLDNFFDLGGHSLMVIDLCERVERKFRKSLAPATVLLNPTIEGLAAVLRREVESPPWSFLMPFRPLGSRTPFFCISGNEALAACMPPGQPFYGLQLHGQDGRRIPSTLEQMAADHMKEIRALQHGGPYQIGGFSFGATVAFEIARQLREGGHAVALLVLLDPDRLSEDPSYAPAGFPSCRERAGRLESLPASDKVAQASVRMRQILQSRLAAARTAGKRLAWQVCLCLGIRLPTSLRKPYLLEARRRAAQRYMPQVHPGPVVLFHTEARSPALRREWSKFAGGPLDVHEIPGGHMDLLREPNVSVVAAILERYLAGEPPSLVAGREASATRVVL